VEGGGVGRAILRAGVLVWNGSGRIGRAIVRAQVLVWDGNGRIGRAIVLRWRTRSCGRTGGRGLIAGRIKLLFEIQGRLRPHDD